MHAENARSTLEIWQADVDLSVESTRSEQCLVEYFRNVRGRQDNDTFVAFESVHLRKQLVDGLLSLVVAHAEALRPLSTDRVELINEDDAWGVLLRLLEEIPDT